MSPLIQKTIKSIAGNICSKKGQTLVEYALILAFISVVAIAVLIGLGKKISSTFSSINNQLSVAVNSH